MKKFIFISMTTFLSLVSCSKSDDFSGDVKTSSPCVRTTSVQCIGKTQSGARCTKTTLSCNGYCYLHGGN